MKSKEFDYCKYAMCCVLAIVADIATMFGLLFCVIIAVVIDYAGLPFGFYIIPLLIYLAYIMSRGYGHYLLSIGGVEDRFAARKKHPIITYGISK